MIDVKFKELSPNPQNGLYSAEHVSSGIPIPKTKRIELFSPDEWEEFTEEWATSLDSEYCKVKRFAGAGDQGLDVVGFISDHTFSGGWDNYQCKYYDHALYPGDAWVEIGKIIYYTYRGDYPPPNNYYFVAPKQVGTTLGKLLAKPDSLKSELRQRWASHCQEKITDTEAIILEGELLKYFDEFDFTIFDSTSLIDMIKGHASTPFHTVRFGGGLGLRPAPIVPDTSSASMDRRYVRQLLAAYAEANGDSDNPAAISILEDNEKYKRDFHRQRERFYHAESLRNFSRDTVPEGTFEQLQHDIYHGVVDVCEDDHATGLGRMKSTVRQAATVSTHSCPLASVTKVADKQGICHQLVDDNRLSWVEDNE